MKLKSIITQGRIAAQRTASLEEELAAARGELARLDAVPASRRAEADHLKSEAKALDDKIIRLQADRAIILAQVAALEKNEEPEGIDAARSAVSRLEGALKQAQAQKARWDRELSKNQDRIREAQEQVEAREKIKAEIASATRKLAEQTGRTVEEITGGLTAEQQAEVTAKRAGNQVRGDVELGRKVPVERYDPMGNERVEAPTLVQVALGQKADDFKPEVKGGL